MNKKDLTEENISLLNIYANILNNCTNSTAKRFIISRIYKILSKKFKDRKPADFPETSYDTQVVNLVAFLKEGKIAYAFLYASSLYYLNTLDRALNKRNGINKSFKLLYQYLRLPWAN